MLRVDYKWRERRRNMHWSDFKPILRHVMRDENTLAMGMGAILEFERRFSRLHDSRHALLMNSGTAALHSAFFAVGVRPGTEVIVPTYSWFASAAPILQCGGTPVFCDIDPETLTADPADVEARITPKTRAICVVHVWGNPARLDRFVEICRRHDLALIEDCAHAHGATYKDRPVGSWGDVGCFSLQGVKAVSGGEAGIAITNDPVLFDRMLALGHTGRTLSEQIENSVPIDNMSLGIKYRPHLFAACLALGSLGRLAELNRLRRRNLAILKEELAGCEALKPVGQYESSVQGGILEFHFTYHQEAAGNWTREAFVRAAQSEGVPLIVDRYTMSGSDSRLLHESKLFNRLDYASLGGPFTMVERSANQTACPKAEKLAEQLVSLPAMAKVRPAYVRRCAEALRKVADFAASEQDIRTTDCT